MPELSRLCIPYTPFAGKLETSRIGIVTTAGVHLKDQPAFNPKGDTSFRLIPTEASQDQLTLTHEHYDLTDAQKDINTVFPIEILRRLVTGGQIGATTPEHISMGFSQAMREIKEKVSIEIAQTVRKWKPDAMLLTAG